MSGSLEIRLGRKGGELEHFSEGGIAGENVEGRSDYGDRFGNAVED